MRWEEPHHPGPGLQLERHNNPLLPTLQHNPKFLPTRNPRCTSPLHVPVNRNLVPVRLTRLSYE